MDGVSVNDYSQDSKVKRVWERHLDSGGCHRKVGYGGLSTRFRLGYRDYSMRTTFLNMYDGSHPNAKFQAWINFVGICWRFVFGER